MQSSSRRAFLRGRRLPQSPWEQFCERLRRSVSGEFVQFQAQDATGSARLTVGQPADVYRARDLCDQYGVIMALDGLAMPMRHADQPVLWLRPGAGMARCERIASHGNKWFVQPGCTLGKLRTVGFQQFDALPAHTTVAAWLADRTLSDYAIGSTASAGLDHASVLLGDGKPVTLGPFGKDDARPLQGLRLQQLAPALFRLAGSAEALECQGAPFWPVRYRLDALMQAAGGHINLAHLLLGHGGDLGWLEWAVLDADARPEEGRASQYFSTDAAEEGGWGDAATTLEWEIKSLFDPHGVFPGPGQDL